MGKPNTLREFETQIKTEYSAGLSCYTLARKYRVSVQAISRLLEKLGVVKRTQTEAIAFALKARRERKTKVCLRCGMRKKISNFYYRRDHKNKTWASSRAWATGRSSYCAQCARVLGVEENRRKNYGGLLPSDYKNMLEAQRGRCAICHVPGQEMTRGLGVDHNHKTGKIRALLCGNCNAALGLFHDSENILRKAAEYLKKHSAPAFVR